MGPLDSFTMSGTTSSFGAVAMAFLAKAFDGNC